MNIESGNLLIRNAIESDCQQLSDWWNDGTVMAHAGFPKGLGITTEKIQQQLAEDSDETGRRHIILYKDRPIGEMSYYNRGNSTAEIGIKICEPPYQEKGLGRIILSMFIKELFAMDYTKIILDTNLKNERAQHVYELLGFQKVRVNIDSWRDQLGQLQSAVDYELAPENFKDWEH